MAEYEINEEPGFEGHGGVREASDRKKAVDAYVRDQRKASWGKWVTLYVRERGTRDVVQISLNIHAIDIFDPPPQTGAGKWSGR